MSAEPACPSGEPSRSRRWLVWAAVALLAGSVVVAGRFLDLGATLATVREWVSAFGPWGPAAFVGIYVGAVLVGVPGTPLTVLSALLFGPRLAFVVMVVATTIAAAAGFLLARYAARDGIARRLRRHRALDRMLRLVEGNDWFVVPFLHLMPVMPFSLTNYAMGLTRLPLWRYLLWSELVMIPMNAVWVFGAHAFWRMLVRGETSWGLLAATTGAGAALLVLGIVIKRAMQRVEARRDAGTERASGRPAA